MDINLVLILSNTLIVLIVLLYYYNKVRTVNVGVVIIFMYFTSSIFSIVLFINEAYFYSGLTLQIFIEPILYFNLVFLFLIYPILRFRDDQIKSIGWRQQSGKIMLLINVFLIMSIFSLAHSIPAVIRASAYDALQRYALKFQGHTFVDSNRILTIIYGFRIALNNVYLFLFFFLITFVPGRKYFKILNGILVFAIPFLHSYLLASRNILVFVLFSTILSFVIFRKFMNTKIRRAIKGFLTLVGIAFVLIIVVISYARFEDKREGVDYYIISYLGQSQLNFNRLFMKINDDVLLKGENTFSFIIDRFHEEKKVIPEYAKRLLNDEKVKRLMGFKTVTAFSTFIGDYVLDFGPFISLLFFIAFFAISNLFPKSLNIPFHRLLLFYFYSSILFEGVFYFTYKTGIGNISLMLYILVYLYLRIDFKEGSFIRK